MFYGRRVPKTVMSQLDDHEHFVDFVPNRKSFTVDKINIFERELDQTW